MIFNLEQWFKGFVRINQTGNKSHKMIYFCFSSVKVRGSYPEYKEFMSVCFIFATMYLRKCKKRNIFDKNYDTFFTQVNAYLKVGELGVVEVRVDVQRSAHHQQGLELV